MKLNVRESGEGDRVAVLIHGFNCDSGDWWELTPKLLEKGYHVEAVDLRGHGLSPRAESYLLADFADDVVETVGTSPELIIGHSLGALVTGAVVGRLRPARAIYLDPVWSPVQPGAAEDLFPPLDEIPTMSDEDLGDVLRASFPRWSEKAIQVDIESWRRWDPKTAVIVGNIGSESGMPASAVVRSLVIAADPSVVLREPEQKIARERGFEVRVAPGLTHSLFRDDFTVFYNTIADWL